MYEPQQPGPIAYGVIFYPDDAYPDQLSYFFPFVKLSNGAKLEMAEYRYKHLANAFTAARDEFNALETLYRFNPEDYDCEMGAIK